MIQKTTLLMSLALPLLATGPVWAGAGAPGHTHDEEFSAGEPGNPKQPARVVPITMQEGNGKMMFMPAKVEVKKGEQIKFVIRNSGALDHEFVLASTQDNLKHAALMKKYPDMVHDDPNAKRVAPGKVDTVVWKFTKPGTYEFSCLIPGHREAGMIGQVIVK